MTQTADIFAGLDGTLDEGRAEDQRSELRGRFTSSVAARQYARAGKGTLTLVSTRTGQRFTYRLRLSDDQQAVFVGLLTGPDNTSSYRYLGRIARDIFWAGRRVPRDGDVSRDAPSVKAFEWAWKKMAQGCLPSELEVWHEGCCGRCGRKLTVPASVAAGFGPECSSRMGATQEELAMQRAEAQGDREQTARDERRKHEARAVLEGFDGTEQYQILARREERERSFD